MHWGPSLQHISFWGTFNSAKPLGKQTKKLVKRTMIAEEQSTTRVFMRGSPQAKGFSESNV
jgi:hypothetical protein